MMQYVELHCKSNFSFLRGASHPDELVTRASELQYRGLALTDLASVAGVVRGFAPAKEQELQYIVGTEIHPVDCPPMVLWPTDRAAYGRMCRLISHGRQQAAKGEYQLRWSDVAQWSEGMIAGLMPPIDRTMPIDSSKTTEDPQTELFPSFARSKFREVFSARSYLLCEVHHGVDDSLTIQRFRELSRDTEIPLVAAGNVHYHIASRMALHDTITAIRHNTTITAIHPQRFNNSQYHLLSLPEIQARFRDIPSALEATIEIADQCRFQLDDLRYEYPTESAPPGMTLIEHLRRLTWQGAKQRWLDGVPKKIIDQLRHEIQLIEELRYEAYFLTVWDLVRFARGRGILCQGRGSAANSAVCYCLGVTNVDPSQTDLLFERFVSKERDEAPDIDIDFEHQRREEVLQYLYQKYGRDRAGMTAVVTTYRIRSAIGDVGKALGVSTDCLAVMSKLGSDAGELPDRCALAGLDPKSDLGRRFVYLVSQLIGSPRHLSQHTGGMVMTAGRLDELCPIENASMTGRTVIQWNKDDLDELGILKVDVLALGMLSALRRCFELVQRHHDHDLSLANIPANDTPTYDMICRADTVGVFQIESRAQMSMLPRLQPRCFYDLVIEVAIVRPGPIQGGMVHPFLRARENPGTVNYPNDEIQKVLEKTLGVPLFQEQAMRLAVVAAGFTPGQADQLRRAMAAWRRPGVIENFRAKLLDGMRQRGLKQEFAEQVFHQIKGFGQYGFPESHAASFALLVYASCYLKCHYPAAFCAAILNSQPMGFYAPAQLVDDAKKHGVEVLPPDVNHSDVEAILEGDSERKLRLGLQSIRSLPREVAEEIVAQRKEPVQQSGSVQRSAPRLYQNVSDLVKRCRLGQSALSILADADALGSLAGDRRAAVWHSLGQAKDPTQEPLFNEIDQDDDVPETLMPMTPAEEVNADYQTTGLSLKAHPISFLRDQLDQERCVRASDLPHLRDGRHVRVAGLVLMRQRPSTAKGITFVTLEDETGPIHLVLFQKVWQRFFQIARTSNAWRVDGKLENRKGVIHVIVGRVTDVSDQLNGPTLPSRDFH